MCSFSEKHTPGTCHICSEDKPVRWKNIYHMGSEGLWICMECERELLHYLEERKRHFSSRKKQIALAKKINFPKLFNKKLVWESNRKGYYTTMIPLTAKGVSVNVSWSPKEPNNIGWVEYAGKVSGNSGLDDIDDFQKEWKDEVK